MFGGFSIKRKVFMEYFITKRDKNLSKLQTQHSIIAGAEYFLSDRTKNI